MGLKLRIAVLPVALVLGACATTASTSRGPMPAPTAGLASQWRQQVSAISDGDSSAERGQAIRERLSAMGLAVREQDFTAKDLDGTNLFADLGGPADKPLLLVGAHYDRVAVGRGVTDNASGAASVLELAAALKARPLRNHRVAIAFWDLEERGLLGSKAYVSGAGAEKPALYVNLDVFGWGDSLWMMTPEGGRWLEAETAEAAQASGLRLSIGEKYPPSDHLAFLQAEWPAVSFALLDHDEIEGVLAAYAGAGKDAGARPAMPKVMQVIHSERDTIDEIESGDVAAALRAIEEALRAWDAAQAP